MLTKIIRLAEKRYYSDKFVLIKENVRDTWKEINKILKDTTGVALTPGITKIKHNELITEDPKTIANIFNDYFTNIGQNLAKKYPLFLTKPSMIH